MTIANWTGIAGGIALFLYGIRLMGDGLRLLIFIAKFNSKVTIYALTKNLKTDIFPSLTCFLILNGIIFWKVYIVSVQCRGRISI